MLIIAIDGAIFEISSFFHFLLIGNSDYVKISSEIQIEKRFKFCKKYDISVNYYEEKTVDLSSILQSNDNNNKYIIFLAFFFCHF